MEGEFIKLNELKEYLKPLIMDGLCIAFSGGVDSSLLLKVACDLAQEQTKSVLAVTFDTTLHPKGDITIAQKVAKELGAQHHIINVDERKQVDIKFNPVDRCYRCKKYLFENLIEFSNKNNLKYIIDGTNFDDLSAYRPGIQALKELNIRSPLAELQITKKEVRKLSELLSLSVATRPSAPCLATRLPYNTEISWDLLRNIEKGEDFLIEKGFQTCRLRVHKDILRIELPTSDFIRFLSEKENILNFLKELGFIYITLDLEGFRSGSMDIYVQGEQS